MSNSTYLAAESAAIILESHFSTLIALAIIEGEQNIATAPSKEIIESIINASFWASLRKEEGNSPKISIAFLTPDEAEQPLVFGKKLLLTPTNLTKLAPGVERAGIHLGIWEENGVPYIWGTTLKIPNYCFVLDVSEPGLIVIKHRRLHGFGKFTNVVVIKGDEIKIVNKDCGAMKDCPAIVTALLDLDAPCSWNNGINALIMLAVSMRGHHHGGILLVVPPKSDDWKQSLVSPLQYPIQPSFNSLAYLIKDRHLEVGQPAWQSAIKSEVDNIAGLTAVDGATVITRDLHLLTFGAKIVRRQNGLPVDDLAYIEPVLGGEAISKYASEVGGTRHLSAAQFINDQRDAFALVASQDGHFTVFSWSPISQKVQAHRIETLLL